MAEEGAPAGQMANLHLDEVTGERVRFVFPPATKLVSHNNERSLYSKSELKKRIKEREKEEKKASKQAALPSGQAQTAKKTAAEDGEADLTPNVRQTMYWPNDAR